MASAAEKGALVSDPARSVFINCPYDKDFQRTFDAIFFATVCCRFTPRSALETNDVSVSRIARILDGIFTSQYSIHDLTRCRGEGDEQLARFNMPLELGMALARQYQTTGTASAHDWFVLVPQGHLYGKFVSDLAGFDPGVYDGRPESAVPLVMKWLASRRSDEDPPPKPRRVLAVLPEFEERKAELDADWCGSAPWKELISAASEVYARLL